MALAVVFLRLEFLYDLTGQVPSRGHHPALNLLLYLNLPVTMLLKPHWGGYLPTLRFDGLAVAAIGLLWYSVALLINSYRERRTALPFTSAPLKVATDLLLIAAGGSLGLVLVLLVFQSAFRH
jgi:hypothetical protein